MADVMVEFGAKIDELTAAVDHVKDKLGEVEKSSEKVSEKFEGLESVTRSLHGALEALGIIAAYEFIESMARLGTTIERTSALLGVSTEAVGELSIIAKATGSDLHAMTITAERMALTIQRSASDAFSPAALALNKLGLGAKDFQNLNADQAIDKLAQAASRFNVDFQLSQGLMAIGGRGMQSLIPIIAQGSGALQKMRQDAHDVGATIDEYTTEQLGKMHLSLVLLQGSLTGAAARITAVFAPSIMETTRSLASMVGELSMNIAAGNFLEQVMSDLKYIMESLMITARNLGTVLKQFFTFDWSGMAETEKRELEEQEFLLFKHGYELEDILTKSKAMLTERAKEVSEAIKKGLDFGNLGLDGKKQLEAAMKNIDGQIKLWDLWAQEQKEIYDRDASQFRITEVEKLQFTAAASIQRYQQELTLLNEKLKLWGLEPAMRAEIEAKILEIKKKMDIQLITADKDTTAAMAKNWENVLSPIQRAWDSQLRGLLTGTTTWAQAMKNIFLDLTIAIIEAIENYLVKRAALALAGMFGDPATKAAHYAAILGDAGQAFAGFTAFLAPVLGPGAIAAAEGLTTGMVGQALAMGSAESGMWEVPATGPLLVHKDEMILPSNIAEMVRSGDGGGGTVQVSFNINTIDGGSLTNFLRTGGGAQITQFVARAMSQNPTLRPSY